MNGSVIASIVGHGGGAMVGFLDGDLLGCPEISLTVVTQNIAKVRELPFSDKVVVRCSSGPRDYGVNHKPTNLQEEPKVVHG